MQASPNNTQLKIEQRILTMRILWGAMFSSIALYYLLTLFAQAAEATPNATLSVALLVVGLLMIPVSVVIKKKLLARAIEQQRPKLVQQSYILALAITEVPALLGVLDHFATGHPHYFLLFIIAALGQLLHFPRRQHVEDAYFKNAMF